MSQSGPSETVFDATTELGRAYLDVDWAATSLGPIGSWSASLRTTVRLMMRSRFAMWMAWGPDLIFFCNDKYREDTLGDKFPWALGRPAAVVWAEIWPDVESRVDAVVRHGESTWDEGLMLFLERSGYPEETYHTFSYSPLADDDGSVAGLFCVVSEDTRRVVSERRIAALRGLAGDLAAASTEAEVSEATRRQLADDPWDMPFVIAYDLDGEVVRRAWSVGIPEDHPAARDGFVLGDPDGPWPSLDPLHADRSLIELDGRFVDLPTGAWSDPPTRAVGLPLYHSGEDVPYGALVIALNRHRPIDEDYLGFLDLLVGQHTAAASRARIFEAERLRAEQMAELDRAKTAFFTNVSHELRTPLTLLLGPAEEALADPEIAPGERRRVEIIQRNAERLLKLVNTLLDFSRLESGRLNARYENVELDRYTTELATMFDSAYVRAGLRLEVECRPLDATFFVDTEMWAKIVLNLLSNALKATFDGGVRVRLDSADGGARLRVTDTGIGIPEHELAHLFERFHRVGGARLRTHEGSGIGLALVAELTELHGGRIGVESEPGAGSTFTVWIPAGSAHLPPDSVVAPEPAPAPGSGSPKAEAIGAGYLAEAGRWLNPHTADTEAAADGPAVKHAEGTTADSAARPTVLVVDDNADMRDYVSGLLRDDYRIVTAADGEIALETATQLVPDLVLTDVMMPNLDGFGLLSALRADPATVHIPVIMLSARSGEDATSEGLEFGADDYLVKPFSARELVARVRSNLELDRVRRLVDELNHIRAMLDKAEELAAVGSWEIDVASGRLTGSTEFLRLVGSDPAALRAGGLVTALQRVHPDDRTHMTDAVLTAIRTGESFATEYRLVDGDGSTRTIWTTGAVEPGNDGRAATVHGSVQDITDRRRAEVATAAAAAAREAEAREHAIALELQRSLLPARTFDAEHLEIATFYQSGVEGTEVGGDWYDVIELDAGRTALVLGDVMGRGVRAAAVMGQLRATVRAYARLDVPPDLLLHLLDMMVRELKDTIVTCVYAVYDPADRTVIYANAGHLPPLLTTLDGGTTRLEASGPPLGTGRSWSKPETVVLVPGSVLTLYTDGLVEERAAGIDDGIDALGGLLTPATGPIAGRPAALVERLRPSGTDDDIAILMAAAAPQSGDDRSSTARFEDNDTIAEAARSFVAARLAAWDTPENVVFDAQLVVSELATNAMRHGRPPIDVSLRRAADRVYVSVHDTAAAPPRMRHPDIYDNGGRGLLIVSSIADRWGTRHTDTGKSVWCMVRVPPSSD